MEIKIKTENGYVDADWTIEDCVMVVSPKEVKINATQFNDGDVITCGHNAFHWTCILRGEIEYIVDNMFIEDYCGINSDGTYYLEPSDSDSATWVRYATEEEKKKLFDKLAEEGYEFDFEKKELIKLKWEPKVGDKYSHPSCSITSDWIRFDPACSVNTATSFDMKIIKHNLAFKTKEECQEFCDRLNVAINSVKP